MERSALVHRPESEYAYLYQTDCLHIRLRTKRDDVASVALIQGDPYLFDSAQWYQESKKMVKHASSQHYDYWLRETTAPFKRLQYGFHLIGKDGEEVFYGDSGIFDYGAKVLADTENYFRMPYFQQADQVCVPQWVHQTVWYQIFPERFSNGDASNDPEQTLPWGSKEHPGRSDYYGGDIQGIINKLDYLAALGVTGLYLCPIFAASSNHKYDTIDYYQIDPAFGDLALFKKLIAAAHQRGMKVMLDAVFNHLGSQSPQWQDVLKNQSASKYVDWFYLKDYPVITAGAIEVGKVADYAYDTFAFEGTMPKLNTANPDVQQFLLEIATYWVKVCDIDGWRLDVANEVDHQFWKMFQHQMTALKPEIYLLGEIWHTSQNWLTGDEFHGVMNYAYMKPIKDCLIKKTLTIKEMSSHLTEQLLLYRQQTNEVMFNMLDSHDTTRLLTSCDDDKDLAKSVLTFMFLQPGSPCLYYGTEVGMTGENDPDCRKCMVWESAKQDLDFLSFTKELIAFRKAQADLLAYGHLQFIDANLAEELVILKRSWQGEQLMSYFNYSQTPFELEIKQEDEVLFDFNTAIQPGSILIGEKGFVILKSKLK